MLKYVAVDAFTEGLKKHTLFFLSNGQAAINVRPENRAVQIKSRLSRSEAFIRWQEALTSHLRRTGIPDAEKMANRRVKALVTELS